MKALLRITLTLAGLAFAAQATAQITFYEQEGFAGRSFTTDKRISHFQRYGFNDRASSAVVDSDRWEVCEDGRFNGRCMILRPGRYPSLAAMGLNNRVSSVREVRRNARVDDRRYAPIPAAAAQITFYEQGGFQGRTFTTERQVGNFERYGFNDRASSAVVVGDQWEVCDETGFSGRCVALRPGKYASFSEMGLNDRVSSARIVEGAAVIPEAAAQITFYEQSGFQGRTFTTGQPVGNFERYGFNDRASSAVVLGERWEVCDDAGFRGRCVVLRPGRYPTFSTMGLNDRVSSVRTVEGHAHIDNNRYAPAPVSVYDGRRRNHERLFQANVTSVRAIVGTPEKRCWVEREQITQERSGANIPGAIVGAVIGGILGHQVGGGRGKDIATVGGAVAGAAVGAHVGRNGQQTSSQDVQRCENVPNQARPDYWDVTYNFRGQEHRVQMAVQPGSTITVNEQGEPREG